MRHELWQTSQLPLSLSVGVVSRGNAHHVAEKPSIDKETHIVGQLVLLQLTTIPSQLIPSWRLLVIQVTALAFVRSSTRVFY